MNWYVKEIQSIQQTLFGRKTPLIKVTMRQGNDNKAAASIGAQIGFKIMAAIPKFSFLLRYIIMKVMMPPRIGVTKVVTLSTRLIFLVGVDDMGCILSEQLLISSIPQGTIRWS